MINIYKILCTKNAIKHENHQYKQDFVHKKFNNLMRNYEKLRNLGHNYMQ